MHLALLLLPLLLPLPLPTLKPIVVKLGMHIVDILSFAHGDINIIAVNAEHSDIPPPEGDSAFAKLSSFK